MGETTEVRSSSSLPMHPLLTDSSKHANSASSYLCHFFLCKLFFLWQGFLPQQLATKHKIFCIFALKILSRWGQYKKTGQGPNTVK